MMMNDKKMICFDMDGTIADLYKVDNWLPKLRAEDPTPYEEAEPMWAMNKLADVLNELAQQGWEIRVITWLSKDSSESYKEQVRRAKVKWLDYHSFPYSHFHGVQYGATKADSVRKYAEYAILVDDNAKVRSGWNLGATIDPTACDLIEELKKILGN